MTPEIAHAQKYFAIQARRQEISDALAADVERLELRKQTSEEFKALSGAAKQAGVQDKMFGVFHDAGYRGLYGGMGREAIKRIGGTLPENIPPAEPIRAVAKRVKAAIPRLELEEKDAKGLVVEGEK